MASEMEIPEALGKWPTPSKRVEGSALVGGTVLGLMSFTFYEGAKLNSGNQINSQIASLQSSLDNFYTKEIQIQTSKEPGASLSILLLNDQITQTRSEIGALGSKAKAVAADSGDALIIDFADAGIIGAAIVAGLVYSVRYHRHQRKRRRNGLQLRKRAENDQRYEEEIRKLDNRQIKEMSQRGISAIEDFLGEK